MATEVEKLETKAAKLQAEARALRRKAKLKKAKKRVGPTHGGAREGAGATAKPEGEKRVQESYQFLPDTVEALHDWAQRETERAGKKVSPRVLVEAAVRSVLDLPIDAEAVAVLREVVSGAWRKIAGAQLAK